MYEDKEIALADAAQDVCQFGYVDGNMAKLNKVFEDGANIHTEKLRCQFKSGSEKCQLNSGNDEPPFRDFCKFF